ncbi:alpha/beta hydrolase [Paraburkholderia saeva]|uniref:alpha/beta hydrolase n=1 Tax=Paraburkholderia saeva TaxID=2777537 RepID=UPI001DF87206|nr:alpha/beta hydrolase [Paraburkholderia saeva]CAG4895677.1 Carboxylesterase NlhH [Paraburkholderia saeva]
MNYLDRLDPELAACVRGLPEAVGFDFSNLPLMRELMQRVVAQFQASVACAADVAIEEAAAPGRDGTPPVKVRVFRPPSGEDLLPAVLSIHGGGYVMGDLSSDDVLNGRIASEVGCVVVGVEYRLAPEHPYPAPLEDCYAAMAWLFEHAPRLGVDPARIGLRGMSAGGGLAAALALLVRDRGEFSLCFQMLDYPMLDDRHVTQSSRNDTDPRVWNATANRFGWRSYLGELAGQTDMPPYAVPARAACLAGLPPACLFIGSADLFVDEVTEYACRLNAAGVMTELHVYPGGFHGFELMLPQTALARRFTADNLSALRRGLCAGTAPQLARHEST